MRTHYFNKFPGDDNHSRGHELSNSSWMGESKLVRETTSTTVIGQCILLERAWRLCYHEEYTVGPEYVVSWENGPLGFSIFKVKSLGSYLDRCAIENHSDPTSYALFDLWMKNHSNGEKTFHVYDVKEFKLSIDDEILLRLSI